MYGLYEMQTNELLAFIENGGKFDNKHVSSLSVLNSLYSGKSDPL